MQLGGRHIPLADGGKLLQGYRALLVCLAMGLGLRLLFVIVVLPLLDSRFQLGYAASNYDADGYGPIADSILRGSYSDVQRAPVYPAFVAAVYGLFQHSNLAVKIMQSLVDTGTVGLVWTLSKRIAPNSALGPAAAALYAIYPLAWWRCGFLDKEVLETFALGLFMCSFQLVGMRRSFASGVMLGVANLTKPILLGLPVVVALWLWIQRRRVAAGTSGFGALLIGMLLLIVPWTARNYFLTKQFVPVALENGGMTAFVGNYPPSLGAWEGPHKAEWEAEVARIAAEHPEASQVALDHLYMQAAVREILSQPALVSEMLLLKLWRFWFSTASSRLDALVVPIQMVFLGLAIAGIARRQLPREWAMLLWLLVGYLWVLHALVYAEVRFSLPAMPYVMVFAGSALVSAFAFATQKRGGRVSSPGPVAALHPSR